MGKCNTCPAWNDVIHEYEQKNEDMMSYNIYAKYHTCTEHSEKNIERDNADKPFCKVCKGMSDIDLKRLKRLPKVKNKYIRMMITERMDKFMSDGRTHQKKLQLMKPCQLKGLVHISNEATFMPVEMVFNRAVLLE